MKRGSGWNVGRITWSASAQLSVEASHVSALRDAVDHTHPPSTFVFISVVPHIMFVPPVRRCSRGFGVTCIWVSSGCADLEAFTTLLRAASCTLGNR